MVAPIVAERPRSEDGILFAVNGKNIHFGAAMRQIHWLSITLLLSFIPSAGAETVFRLAENQIPVAMVQINRTPNHTEVRLQVQAPLSKVCWNATGSDSPYLLAEGQRYRFVNGDNITNCPTQRGYAAGEIMVLRFTTLAPQVHEVSLVEGQGGENQLINPASSNTRYWNFLHVKLN
jgi:hypothetical protein